MSSLVVADQVKQRRAVHRMASKKESRMSRRNSPTFSLVELVIVLVIIAVLAAVAILRITRSAQFSGGAALKADLRVLRSAIEQYRAEHEGKSPTVADFVNQLTKFSNQAGDTFADAADTANSIILGPYLESMPSLPVGAKKGKTGVAAAVGVDVGWVYDETTGKIIAGTDAAEKDSDAVAYNTY